MNNTEERGRTKPLRHKFGTPGDMITIWRNRPSALPVWSFMLQKAREKNSYSVKFSREQVSVGAGVAVGTVTTAWDELQANEWIFRTYKCRYRNGVVKDRDVWVRLNPAVAGPLAPLTQKGG
jgi:hypothetical protein